MHCSCFGSRPFCEEFKMWIPLLILVAIGVALPIVFGAYNGLMGIGIFTAVNIGMAWSTGRMTNYGWFPAYVKTQKRLDGKTAIVTGANSGSGFATAKDLVRRGCDVIITCRSQSKVDATIDRIKKELSNENDKLGNIDFVLLDLCSKKSIDAAVESILNKNVEISILINNAGAWLQNAHLTEDGIEAQWQANYLSPFYLTKKLLPNIKATAKKYGYGRIVNVASVAHMGAKVENIEAFISSDKRGDLEYWQTRSTIDVYGDTKCGQILYTMKLQELLNAETDSDGKSVGSYLYVVSLQPGFINSGFMNLSTRPLAVRLTWPIFYPFQATFAMTTPWQGAQTSLHCALSDENVKPGGYHAHCMPQDTKDAAKPVFDTQKDPLYEATDKIWAVQDA